MATKKTTLVTLCLLVISAWLVGFSSQVAAQSNLERFAGTWRVISIETVLPNGEILYIWMGRNPLGLLMYDRTGYMSIQFLRDPRPTFVSGSHRDGPPEEIKLAYEGYYAYFGTYEINETEGTVIYHVEGSLWPEQVGADQKVFYKFSENRLTMTTPPIQRGGMQWVNRVTYERVEKGR